MRKYDVLNEIENPAQIIKQYHYTTALDTFIITITKEEITKGKDKTEPFYNCYISRLNYGEIHHVLGIPEEDYDILTEDAIDSIQDLEKEIAEGTTDC